MIQYLPPIIMFLATVAMASLFAVPITLWKPVDRTVAFYWRGVWMFLMAITAVSGGVSTLMLAGVDAVDSAQLWINILLPAFVGFVVLAWFHLVGLGLIKTGRRALKSEG